MLKRNTRKLIKYVLILFTLITLSILFLKSFYTVNAIDKNNDKSEAKFSGLPNDPSNQKNHLDSSTERKKNWHNYTQMTMEKKRVGPGEQGAAFYLPPGTEKRKDELYKVNGFNGLASDYIAINRSITDIRHKDCAKKKYLRKLPTASVVVPFHNEHLSTLLRTVTSVINRSPTELIKEILLVDDFSTKSELKHELESYLQEHLPKVRVLRATKREGLIRARLMGAKAATGDVLIFLDSHTEANVNWLPPLLEPIAEDPQTVVCPFIDVIDYETFAYRAQDEGARGSFDWELYYKRLPLLPQDLKHPAQPFQSPVMAGGLFAMDRAFFWRLGGYDEGLDVWGGEQYELSFKIWQCGGRMVDAPCSRIGHIYRKFPPFPNPGIGDFVGKNYKRVAEVWMDEYAEYLYLRRPHYRNINPGDLSKQKELRRRLQCKTFKWFMSEIAFDQSKKYPPIEPPPYAYGEIRNAAANLCIDTRFRNQNDRFGIEDCIKDNKNSGGEQNFELTWHKDIRPKPRLVCFDVSTSEDHAPVVLWGCHGMQGNQEWKYDYVKQHLFHLISGHCLDCDIERKEIFMSPCDNKVSTQKWVFHNYNRTALDIWPQV